MRRKAKNQLTPQVSRYKVLNIDQCIAENITFAATLKSKNIKLFVSIIKAMNFVDNTEMQLSDSGLKYVVEESKSFQTTAYIKKEFFSSFYIKLQDGDDMINFGVNLNSFTELLSAFLDNDLSNMKIVYFNDKKTISFTCTQTDSGDQLTNKTKNTTDVRGDEDDEEPAGEITTEYFLKTIESVDPIDFTVNNPALLNSIILNALDFHGILNDFDRTIEELEIKITERRLTLKSVGILQYGALAKLNYESHIFDKFESYKLSKFIYKFMYFKVLIKALALSSKMSLITHVDGTVRIQLMVRSDDEQETSAYIEYFMIPTLPDDESENDE